ncbi:MAG: potassium-transporting ATPase subunit C [Candidatus Riflebacteria bacterium]|nr:potassium-transporting ATPase subunit C [Candidatus Riflebacteria bacterium]
MEPGRVPQLIDDHRETAASGIFGEPRVNVPALSLALDRLR